MIRCNNELRSDAKTITHNKDEMELDKGQAEINGSKRMFLKLVCVFFLPRPRLKPKNQHASELLIIVFFHIFSSNVHLTAQ